MKAATLTAYPTTEGKMPDRTQHIDYEAAVKARAAFREASAALMTAGNDADNPPDAMRLGYAAQACDAVGDAIFNAFNMLASYLGDDEAARVIHLREWEEAQPAYAGMAVKADERMPADTAMVSFENKAEPVRLSDVAPAFVTERVDTCLWEIEAAVAKVPVLANAKVGTVHGTSDGGWRVEVRVNDQVFAPRFDTLDKATEYRREAAEIVERAA